MICLRWNTCSYLISIIDLHLEYINRNCVSGGLVIKISASIIYWFKYFFLQLHQRTFLLGRKKMKCQRNVIFIIIWTILCLSYFGLNSLQGKHSFLKVFHPEILLMWYYIKVTLCLLDFDNLMSVIAFV